MATPLPESPQRIELDGRAVDYHLRRSRRRTIGLTVDHRGLRVGAPLRARMGDIERLIREHGRWVLDKLDSWQQRQAATQLDIREGTQIFLLGEPLTVGFCPQRQRGHHIDPASRQLTLNTRQPPAEALRRALQAEARSLLAQRLAHHAARLGVPTPPLRLSSARTRWGSCNHRGAIALHWRLILMPLPVADYVVCHELAHLKEMNHGPRFWSIVASLCPDWQTRRRELRQIAEQLPVF
jgi:predicted metal-dependent hydrolase